jgi:hypothetical protein
VNRSKHILTSQNDAPVVPGDFYFTDPHTSILRGDLWSCFSELDLIQGETKICQLKTGAGLSLFYGINLNSNITSLTFQMFESPTITDGTTTLTPVNFNRNTARTARYKLFVDPTEVSGGTKVKEFRTYSISSSPVLTTMQANSIYYSLKPDTSYSLHITNNDNQSRKAFAQFVMMEAML